MLGRIDRYIFGLVLKPVTTVVGVALLLLLLDNLLRLFDFTLDKGQPAWVVTTMLATLLPEYLGLALPIGLLLGLALTVRQLALHNELEAFFNAGLSHLRVIRMPIVLAIILTLITFLTVAFIQPKAEYALQDLLYRVRTGQFGMSIKDGQFLRLSDKVTMRVQSVDTVKQQLNSVFLRVQQPDRSNLVLTALSGRLYRDASANRNASRQTIILRLQNGTAVRTNPDGRAPDIVRFDHYDLPVKLPAIAQFRKRGDRKNELTSGELWSLSRDPHVSLETRRNARGRFHRRLIHSILILALPFLAIAMGIPPHRSTSVAGMVIGLASYIVLLKSLDLVVTATPPHVAVILWGLSACYAAFCVAMYRGTVAGRNPFTRLIESLTANWSRIRHRFNASLGRAYRRHAADPRSLG